MDTRDWKYFYKVDYEHGHDVTTNMMYSPKINSEKTMMCMVWDESDTYQHESGSLSKDIIDFFFEREVKYLTYFQKFDWATRLVEVDISSRHIIIEFPGESLNNIVTDPKRNLDIECPDWKEQIFNILKDIRKSGYYKMALYPHCFYLINGKIKTFDFYSCIEMSYPYVERNKLEGLIGPDSGGRFNSSTIDGLVDFSIFFKNTLLNHLKITWADNPFPEFYRKIYEHGTHS